MKPVVCKSFVMVVGGFSFIICEFACMEWLSISQITIVHTIVITT